MCVIQVRSHLHLSVSAAEPWSQNTVTIKNNVHEKGFQYLGILFCFPTDDRRKNNSKTAETAQQQKKKCDILHQSEDELSFCVVAGGCWAGRSSRTDARLPEETFLFSEAAAVPGTSYLLAPRFTLKNIARWFKDFLQCNENCYLNLSIQSIENTASEGLLIGTWV